MRRLGQADRRPCTRPSTRHAQRRGPRAEAAAGNAVGAVGRRARMAGSSSRCSVAKARSTWPSARGSRKGATETTAFTVASRSCGTRRAAGTGGARLRHARMRRQAPHPSMHPAGPSPRTPAARAHLRGRVSEAEREVREDLLVECARWQVGCDGGQMLEQRQPHAALSRGEELGDDRRCGRRAGRRSGQRARSRDGGWERREGRRGGACAGVPLTAARPLGSAPHRRWR